MQLSVRLYARARDLAGSETISVEVSDNARVADLRSALESQHPELGPIVSHLLVAVGTDYADETTQLNTADDISCFPPVSGG